MRHEFHPEALVEYEDSARYYEACNKGLGLRFLSCVESAISQITEDPMRGRIFEEDIRRSLTQVFPYGILYTIEGDYVLIIAVMHCSREPGYWNRRIEHNT